MSKNAIALLSEAVKQGRITSREATDLYELFEEELEEHSEEYALDNLKQDLENREENEPS